MGKGYRFEPEILRGLGVDWEGYVPSGGRSFHEEFAKDSLGLDKAIEVLRRRNAEIDEFQSAKTDMRSKAGDTVKFIETLEAIEKLRPGDFGKELKDWIAATKKIVPQVVKGLLSDADDRDEKVEIHKDMMFLQSLKDVFLLDRDVDALLYAIPCVDLRFRKKIFRRMYSKFLHVLLKIDFIKRYESPFKNQIMRLFDPAFNTLDEAYGVLAGPMREKKRRLDKHGLAEIADWTMNDLVANRNGITLGGAGAMPTLLPRVELEIV